MAFEASELPFPLHSSLPQSMFACTRHGADHSTTSMHAACRSSSAGTRFPHHPDMAAAAGASAATLFKEDPTQARSFCYVPKCSLITLFEFLLDCLPRKAAREAGAVQSSASPRLSTGAWCGCLVLGAGACTRVSTAIFPLKKQKCANFVLVSHYCPMFKI